MRITLSLDDALLHAAKQEATARGVTLTQVIEEALRAELTSRPPTGEFRLDLPVVWGGRPPDVDISDRDALYRAMDDDAGPPGRG